MVRERIGLIYLINQPLTIFWGLLASKWHRIPIISVVHNTFCGGETPKSRVTRMLMTRADAIVAVAEMQREHLVRDERIPESLVRVIHNGIDLVHFKARVGSEEKRQSLGLNRRSPIVGIIGRLVALKGIDIFLQAAKAVLKDLPGTQFVIVGDGPEGESLKNLSRALRIESSVLFLGRRDDIADLIQVFDIGVLCSRTEALPMVILEYMALAKPVISTRVGSVAELVTHEETGLVIRAEDAKDLADALLALLRQPGRARQMGLAGRARVEGSFSVSNTVEKTQQLFSELLRR
jgi:glycosyltransferase involved in cell wall biosynthesis